MLLEGEIHVDGTALVSMKAYLPREKYETVRDFNMVEQAAPGRQGGALAAC